VQPTRLRVIFRGRFGHSPVRPVLSASFRESRVGNWDTSRCLELVVRHARIGAGDAIKDVIEWNFGTVKITVLAGVGKPLGFALRR
jgi:hypothetical protein